MLVGSVLSCHYRHLRYLRAHRATSYQWNAYGQLCWSGVTTSPSDSCSSPPSKVTTYTYNGQGLRMTETPSKGTALTFTWDTNGQDPLLIDDGTYAYIYGDPLFGGTAPIEQIKLSTSKVDYLSSIPSGVQDVFKSSGAVDQQTAYTTYGQEVLEAGTSQVTAFGFQGTYSDPSGLDYMVNRYYDPTSDQFLWSTPT